MTHEIRKGEGANPSEQQMKNPSDPSPDSAEGITLDELQSEDAKAPGGKEASEAKNKGKGESK